MSGIDFIQDLGLVMLIAAAAAWLCQRLGLSAVIGYILAGILVGPHTHSHGLILDADRIQSLAQIGLVFLIFSIGQGIRIQRLRKAGLPLALATLLIAAMVLAGCRLLGATLGWPGRYSLVLAAMLMVSSTAVLGKSLREAGATHHRFGQTARTITVLDDLVAIVSLTLIASMIQFGQADSLVVLSSVVRLKAVIITLVIGALLFVPQLLNRLGPSVSSEVRSLVIVGLLLAMALLSAKAGFSAALGAFLLGTIVASTRQTAQVERVLGGLSEVFAPVFFVAMGMLFDFRSLLEIWPLALGIFLFAVTWRIISATLALLMVGHPVSDAARAAMCLAPIGEFSLIIALTGVQGGIVPPSFYALGIAVCLLTSITTPILIRNSQVLSDWVGRRQPGFLAQWIVFYHEWMASLKQRQRSSLLWKLAAPRLVQVAMQILFISGLLVFARPVYSIIEKWLGMDSQIAAGLPMAFGLAFGVLLLAPLIALWRTLEALSMMCAESSTRGRSKQALLRPLFENLLKGFASIGLLLWLAAFVPYTVLPLWSLCAVGAGTLALGVLFWRRLIRLHSRFEIELRKQLADSPFVNGKNSWTVCPESNGALNMNLAEHIIREETRPVARTISELPLRHLFSITIVNVERQGVAIPNPSPDTVLYPNDKLLLLGQEENLRRAEQWLNGEPDPDLNQNVESSLTEFSLEHLTVPMSSRHLGKSLEQLSLPTLFGIQIVGIERGQGAVLSPGRSERLLPGDELLVLGMPEQINEMAFWLST
ncbi:MAG TPA: cation:proton antiporter [Candidatus Paceibacterota bacterium]|nr:cation:proton antiporter [Verrucomicrobiota bacterium]HRY50422.1 cation:proton antiporter [Candidatus Paceibacterota bacterium]HRZ99505.1 cation:proton antiporter [Candidatus Paceibacterota bacterium]